MDGDRKSTGSPLEVGRIPTVTETERRRNGTERLAPSARLRRPDRKNLRLEPEPSSNCASRSGPPEEIRDGVLIRTNFMGAADVRLAMQLLAGWWRAGYRSEPHLLALVDWFVEKRGAIRSPFAYFNAGSPHFRDMHASIAARLAEAEGEAHKESDRAAIRSHRLAEVRAEVEDFTP